MSPPPRSRVFEPRANDPLVFISWRAILMVWLTRIFRWSEQRFSHWCR